MRIFKHNSETVQEENCELKKNLVENMGHAAYLGREIEKACLALKNNLEYVQDDELKL